MAVHESKVPEVQLPLRLDFSTEWQVFGRVSLQRVYTQLTKLLEHLKEDAANAPPWDTVLFDSIIASMADDSKWPGTQNDLTQVVLAIMARIETLSSRIDALESWQTTVDTTLADHESRISALENP